MCKKLLIDRYPDKEWNEEKFMKGFNSLDKSWVVSEENGDYVESKDLIYNIAQNLQRQKILAGLLK